MALKKMTKKKKRRHDFLRKSRRSGMSALWLKKSRSKRYIACSDVADEVGFEPTSPVRDYRISSAGRYDHFDTHPYLNVRRTHSKAFPEYRSSAPNKNFAHRLLRKNHLPFDLTNIRRQEIYPRRERKLPAPARYNYTNKEEQSQHSFFEEKQALKGKHTAFSWKNPEKNRGGFTNMTK